MEMTFDSGYAPQGWQCPICKRVYSPLTPMCWYCGEAGATKTYTTTNATTNTNANAKRAIKMFDWDWENKEDGKID